MHWTTRCGILLTLLDLLDFDTDFHPFLGLLRLAQRFLEGRRVVDFLLSLSPAFRGETLQDHGWPMLVAWRHETQTLWYGWEQAVWVSRSIILETQISVIISFTIFWVLIGAFFNLSELKNWSFRLLCSLSIQLKVCVSFRLIWTDLLWAQSQCEWVFLLRWAAGQRSCLNCCLLGGIDHLRRLLHAKERSILAIELRLFGIQALLLFFLLLRIRVVVYLIIFICNFACALRPAAARAEVAEKLKLLALVKLLCFPLGDFGVGELCDLRFAFVCCCLYLLHGCLLWALLRNAEFYLLWWLG